MKAYTDTNQSKLLAEILPKESADMSWISIYDENHMMSDHRVDLLPYSLFSGVGVPCWSLTALLAQMPCVELVSSNDGHYRAFWHEMYSKWHSNPVDACTELLNRDHLAENSDLINE